MADLSDADWQKLLGKDYKAKILERDAAAGVTDASRAAKSKADMLANFVMTGLSIGVVASVIFATNYYAVSGPYNATLAMGSGIVALASFAIAAYFSHAGKK